MLKQIMAIGALMISSAVVAGPYSKTQYSSPNYGPASTAAEAKQWYDSVYAPAFIKGEGFLELYEKYIFVGLGDNTGYYPKDQLMAKLETYIQPWIKAGWVSSELVSTSAKPIGENGAIVTAVWRLKTKDGKAVLKCTLPAWHYIMAKQRNGWLVISEFEAPCADSKAR